MLVRSHRPYGLERQPVPATLQIAVAVLPFQPEEDELALPPGHVGRDSPLGVLQPPSRFDPIVSRAEDPALAGSRLKIQKSAVPIGGGAEVIGVEPIALGPEGDVFAGARFRWAIGRPEVHSYDPATQPGVVIVSAQSRHPDLRVGRAAQLPEILQPAQQHRLRAAAEERIASGGGRLQPDLVGRSIEGEWMRGVMRDSITADSIRAES